MVWFHRNNLISSPGVAPTCCFKSKAGTVVNQETLEYLMQLFANKLYDDAFFSQQYLTMVHTAKST